MSPTSTLEIALEVAVETFASAHLGGTFVPVEAVSVAGGTSAWMATGRSVVMGKGRA